MSCRLLKAAGPDYTSGAYTDRETEGQRDRARLYIRRLHRQRDREAEGQRYKGTGPDYTTGADTDRETVLQRDRETVLQRQRCKATGPDYT